MPEVLAIENKSFDDPWQEEDFIKVLRRRNCIGMVAEAGENIVGFMVYELSRDKLHVINLAVSPIYRRLKVGYQLLEKLKSKLSPKRRTHIDFWVRESSLDAQLFLKRNGFLALDIERNFYNSEDAYLMRHSADRSDAHEFVCFGGHTPVNRLTHLFAQSQFDGLS